MQHQREVPGGDAPPALGSLSMETIQETSEILIFADINGDIAHFIALIHPIQWTIANLVGADQPAKPQKKTSCVSTGQAGPVLCTRQMACRTSFLSRQSDVIASFSFGARSVQAIIFCVRNFEEYSVYFWSFCFLVIPKWIIDLIAQNVIPGSMKRGLWPCHGDF